MNLASWLLISTVVAGCVADQVDETTAALGSGSGSGSACPAPVLAASLAPTPLTTELRTTNRITTFVTTTGYAGGTVLVKLEAWDASSHQPVSGWTITPQQTVLVPASGAVVLTFDVTIPSDSATLAADVRVRAMGGGYVVDGWGRIDVAKQVTIDIAEGTGSTNNHVGVGPDAMNVRAGTDLHFANHDTQAHVIHGQGGIVHEMVDGGGVPGGVYAVTVNASGLWYCHTHEGGSGHVRTVTVVP